MCLVDADRWFVPAFKDAKLHAKNILFCLKDMNRYVDPLWREEFLSLQPEKLLNAWVARLKTWGERCQMIFNDKIETYYARSNPVEKTALLPPIKFHVVFELFNQMELLQVQAETKMKLTHWGIVGLLQNRLANHYQTAQAQTASPLKCFEYAAGHAYQRGKRQQGCEYFTSRIDFKTQQEDLWESVKPEANLVKTWQRDMDLLEKQLEGIAETPASLARVVTALEKEAVEGFKALSLRGKQKVLEKLDAADLSETTQTAIITILKAEGHWTHLTLKGFKDLQDKDVAWLLQSSPQLKTLELENLPQLTYKAFEAALTQENHLKQMTLIQLPKLEYMGYQEQWNYREQQWKLPNLEKLKITACEKLQEVHIQAPLVETVDIQSAPLLKVLRTKSQRLKLLTVMPADALPPKEWPLIVHQDYANHLEKLDFGQRMADKAKHTVIIARQLITRFPVLLALDWEIYTKNISFKHLQSLLQAFIAYPGIYAQISTKLREHVRQKMDLLLIEFIKCATSLMHPLLKTLNDKESDVRASAAKALGQVGPANDAVVKTLFKALGDHISVVRESAAQALGQLGQANDAVVNALVKALGDNESDSVRQAAAQALGQLGQANDAVVNALIKALGDNESDSVRQGAAQVLGQLGQANDAVVNALVKALGDNESNSVRKVAAQALGQLGQANEAVVNALIKALGDVSYSLRQVAAQALGQLGQANLEVVNAPLVKALGDKKGYVRQSAMQALGQSGQANLEVVNALVKALGDKDSDVRQGAAQALGQLGHILLTKLIDAFAKALPNLLKIPLEPTPPLESTKNQALFSFISPTQGATTMFGLTAIHNALSAQLEAMKTKGAKTEDMQLAALDDAHHKLAPLDLRLKLLRTLLSQLQNINEVTLDLNSFLKMVAEECIEILKDHEIEPINLEETWKFIGIAEELNKIETPKTDFETLLITLINQDHEVYQTLTARIQRIQEFCEKQRAAQNQQVQALQQKTARFDRQLERNFYHACVKNRIHIVSAYLIQGFFVNQPCAEDSEFYPGKTALILAAEQRHSELVALLLFAGADLFILDKNNCNALHYAAKNGHAAKTKEQDGVLEMLINKAKNDLAEKKFTQWINQPGGRGFSALDNAVFGNHLTIVQLLINHGADLKSKNAEGFTPLMTATWRGHAAIVAYLLEKGADISLTIQDRKTRQPLNLVEFASINGHLAVLQVYLEKKPHFFETEATCRKLRSLAKDQQQEDIAKFWDSYLRKHFPVNVSSLTLSADTNENHNPVSGKTEAIDQNPPSQNTISPSLQHTLLPPPKHPPADTREEEVEYKVVKEKNYAATFGHV